MISGLSGRLVDRVVVAIFSISSILISLLVSIFLLVNLLNNSNILYFNLGTWIKVNTLNVSWGFMFDPLAVVMLVVVSTISFCVQLYSFGYMGEDPHLRRFY